MGDWVHGAGEMPEDLFGINECFGAIWNYLELFGVKSERGRDE
jgi:hypothetical protein